MKAKQNLEASNITTFTEKQPSKETRNTASMSLYVPLKSEGVIFFSPERPPNHDHQRSNQNKCRNGRQELLKLLRIISLTPNLKNTAKLLAFCTLVFNAS